MVPCDKSNYDAKLLQMRGALTEHRLQLLPDSVLHAELAILQPDKKLMERSQQIRPRSGQDDHCFDALRYLFNGVYVTDISYPERPLSQIEANEKRMKDDFEARSKALQERLIAESMRKRNRFAGRGW